LIVLDASAAVDLLTRNGVRGDRIAERVAGEFAVHVPAVFDLEVLHALRGLEAGGKLPAPSLEAALVDLADLRATRHPHEQLRPRVWALRNNLTAYDAAYVALAELLEAPLLTSDAPLARSSGHAARIELTHDLGGHR
jgi:predicted nucleic acid-binding protein